jgi:hypothetical protein
VQVFTFGFQLILGPAHQKSFEVIVPIDLPKEFSEQIRVVGNGQGPNKKDAEKLAAVDACQQLLNLGLLELNNFQLLKQVATTNPDKVYWIFRFQLNS